MRPRYLAFAAVILITLGCNQDLPSPTEPVGTTPSLSQSAAALTFQQVSSGGFHTCAVTTTNQAYCWGDNMFGQLGTGSNTGPEQCNGAVGPFACSTRPAPVAGNLRFLQVSAGSSYTCGVTTEHQVYCWGSNGALGDGTTQSRNAPVAVAGGRLYRNVDAGGSHTCAVTTDFRAYCWGENGEGQLGDGTTTRRLIPTAVAGGLSFRQVAASLSGPYFTCGTTTDNRAFCWGTNVKGQVGDSSTAPRRLRPSAVAGKHAFKQVDAGGSIACAVTTGNRAYCWGEGRNQALGNGRVYASFWPRAVSGGLALERVTTGGGHTCAESTTNRAYCWGNNIFGQLGDGTTTNSLTPVAVAGGHFFQQLSAGGYHSCGRTSTTTYCWGYGFFGQLGNGTSSFGAKSTTPDAVSGTS